MAWVFKSNTPLCAISLPSVLTSLPPPSLASPPCDCSATVTGTILSVSQTSQSTFYSWLLTGPAGKYQSSCLSVSCTTTRESEGMATCLKAKLAPATLTSSKDHSDLLRFHFSWTPPPLSQNKWIIRAETFSPHTWVVWVQGCFCVCQPGLTSTTVTLLPSFSITLKYGARNLQCASSPRTKIHIVICSDSQYDHVSSQRMWWMWCKSLLSQRREHLQTQTPGCPVILELHAINPWISSAL